MSIGGVPESDESMNVSAVEGSSPQSESTRGHSIPEISITLLPFAHETVRRSVGSGGADLDHFPLKGTISRTSGSI